MVGAEVEITQEVAQVGVEIVGSHVLAGHLSLIAVKTGEALDLNQLGGVAAVAMHDAEVSLDEHGFVRFVRDTVLRGDLAV